MSGQQPPPWKDPNNNSDNISPPNRAAGRSNRNTPNSSSSGSTAEQRSLLRHIITRGSQALEAVATQPGMPERSAYPTHEAWLRAMLTASLQQSEQVQDIFGHSDEDPSSAPPPDEDQPDGDRGGDEEAGEPRGEQEQP